VVGVFVATGDAVPLTTEVDGFDAPAPTTAVVANPRLPNKVAAATLSRKDRCLIASLLCPPGAHEGPDPFGWRR
jgi:hypothetical protein